MFLWIWTRKSVVPHEFGQTWDRIARTRTQEFEEARHPIFCVEPLLQGEFSCPRRASRPLTFRVRPWLRQFLIALCVCFDQYNVYNEEARHREVTDLSEADLANVTHRKDLTVSGDRMRDRKHSKNHCSIVTRCRFRSRSWQMPILSDQTLIQKRRKMDTCLQRVHTTSQQSRFKISMWFVW